LPYFKSKLQSIYNREMEARLQASLWGTDEPRLDEAGFLFNQGETSAPAVGRTNNNMSSVTPFRKKIGALVAVCYPWIHATNEGS
jgi:peroxin-12